MPTHHIVSCTTLQLHITNGLHFPSTIALVTQLSPITHYCLILYKSLFTPRTWTNHLHRCPSFTALRKQPSHSHSLRSLVLPRLTFWALFLFLWPSRVWPWTVYPCWFSAACPCDIAPWSSDCVAACTDSCPVLFTSLPCLWDFWHWWLITACLTLSKFIKARLQMDPHTSDPSLQQYLFIDKMRTRPILNLNVLELN